jgi:hypothetical protein
MADFKSCHDAYRKNTDKKQKQTETNQRKTTQKPKDSKQNKGRVISRSVHDVGNLKKGDSIVSSKVSCSGIGMAVKPNKPSGGRMRIACLEPSRRMTRE